MRVALRRGAGKALEQGDIERLLAVAAHLVRQYLSSADDVDLPPAVVEEEAILRVAGYLADAPAGPIASITKPATTAAPGADSYSTNPGRDVPRRKGVPEAIEYARSMISPVRASGAMAMLTRYKRRGARTLAVE